MRTRHFSQAIAVALLFTFAACSSGPSEPGTDSVAFAVSFSTAPSGTVAGAALAAITIHIVNAVGQQIASATNTVQLQLLVPAAGPVAAVSGKTSVAASAGSASFDSVVVRAAGTGFRLIATASGLKPDTSAAFDVAAAAATQLAFSAAPVSARAGIPVASVRVAVSDAFGNPAGGSVTIALDSAPGAALSGTATQPAVSGTASFNDLRISLPGFRNRLRASLAGATDVSSGPFNVGARLRILDTVTAASAGALPTVRVAIQTDSGVLISSASATIQLAVAGGPAPQPASGSRSAASTNGTAAITGVIAARPGAGYRLKATANSTLLDADSSPTFSVTWTAVQIAAGGAETCSVSSTGAGMCVGLNGNDVMGVGTTDSVEVVPVLVRSTVQFKSVSVGGHICGLTASGQAWCWGDNSEDQLGIGVAGGLRDSATAVAGSVDFLEIHPANNFTCGLGTDSLAYCWGADFSGTLGTGVPGNLTTPTSVAGGHTFVGMSTGASHSCALTAAGQAWCWGLNADHELGDGSNTDRTMPVLASQGRAFSTVAAGTAFTCALDSSGAAWCWGLNDLLGNPAFNALTGNGYSDTAVAVAGGLQFTTLRAGDNACGLTAGGALYCWGRAIGSPNGTAPVTQPTLVPGGLTWSSFSVGRGHVCGVTANGIYCFGSDSEGQLGTGSPRTNSTTPVRMVQ